MEGDAVTVFGNGRRCTHRGENIHARWREALALGALLAHDGCEMCAAATWVKRGEWYTNVSCCENMLRLPLLSPFGVHTDAHVFRVTLDITAAFPGGVTLRSTRG